MVGYKIGQSLGDVFSSNMNIGMVISTRYVTGQDLVGLRTSVGELIAKSMNQNMMINVGYLGIVYSHINAIMEGPKVLDMEYIGKIPSEKTILARAKIENNASPTLLLNRRIHFLTRAVLFRQLDDPLLKESMSDMLSNTLIQVRFIILFGTFIEGLVSFELAHRAIASDEEKAQWLAKGELVLRKITRWNEHCAWNFENK